MTIVNFESVEQNLDELLSLHLFDSIPDACVVLDERFHIVRMNSKAEQVFLFPKEYMMSKTFWEISPQYINTLYFMPCTRLRMTGKRLILNFAALLLIDGLELLCV